METKRSICFNLAKILNSLHTADPPLYHGHLSSHNVFIETSESEQEVKVQVGQAEMRDLAKYANIFYNYRVASVWSSPECLKQKRKLLDPTAKMDVYSFGLILWELWHEKIPFEGNMDEAT